MGMMTERQVSADLFDMVQKLQAENRRLQDIVAGIDETVDASGMPELLRPTHAGRWLMSVVGGTWTPVVVTRRSATCGELVVVLPGGPDMLSVNVDAVNTGGEDSVLEGSRWRWQKPPFDVPFRQATLSLPVQGFALCAECGRQTLQTTAACDSQPDSET